MPPHAGRCLLILLRIEFFVQRGRRLEQDLGRNCDINQLAGRSGQQRAVADGKKAEAKVGELPVLDARLRCKADDRIVAMPAGKLMKEMRRIFRTRRQFHGDQKFLRRKRSFVDPGEEFACCDPPLAAWPARQ